MNRIIFIISLIILVVLASLSLAAIPKMINYQGMLTGADGKTPVPNANYPILFSIYNTSSGGSSLWSHTYNVSVTNGLFNVILGDSGAPINLAFDTTYWLGIKVGADLELSPRIRLTSVGYAYRASVADSAVVAVSAPTGGGWTDDGTRVRLQTSTDSVGIGTTSPAAKLDVNGDVNTGTSYKIGGNRVLSNPGTENVFLGVNAGATNTGIQGTFVGYEAGYRNQGNKNVFLGRSAGYWNTTGIENTFLGWTAGYATTAGGHNTFVGVAAGTSNTTGSNNTFVGAAAGYLDTSAGYNTFVGANAGAYNSTGSGNASLGYCAGYHATGNNNTFLGPQTGVLNTTGSGNVFIGYAAGYNEIGSNKLYIANSDTGPPLIYGDFSTGKVGIGTKSPSAKLTVNDTIANVWPTVPGIMIGNSSGNTAIWMGKNNDNFLDIMWSDPDYGRIYCAAYKPLVLQEYGGRVGIGTNSPVSKLHVSGYEDEWHGKDASICISNTASGGGNWYLRAGATGTATPAGGFSIADEVGYRVFIDNTGNVSIGPTAPSEKLDVDGTAKLRNMPNATGSNENYVVVDASGVLRKGSSTSSSKRYKENIRDLEVVPESILQLNPVRFQWKTTGAEDIGLIAEEVEKTVPDLVVYDKEGKPDAVKYDKVALYLLELAKAQQKEIDLLKGEIEKLKSSGR
jgi:hypothetical protein